jgi:hypothetical protein
MASLLTRMAKVSRAAASLQQSGAFPFVLTPLVPDAASGWAALQLPSDELLQQAGASARQAVLAAQQAAQQASAAQGGLFGGPAAGAEQQQQQMARVKELSASAKVRASTSLRESVMV